MILNIGLILLAESKNRNNSSAVAKSSSKAISVAGSDSGRGGGSRTYAATDSYTSASNTLKYIFSCKWGKKKRKMGKERRILS